MKNMLILGAGDGIGAHLITSLRADYDNVISVSRSSKKPINDIKHIQTSISDFPNHKDFVKKNSISLVVYIPSAWGESGKLTLQEMNKFLEIGPLGLLGSFNFLIDDGYLSSDATLVSIGSIASEGSALVNKKTNNRTYSIAKLTQKAILVQMAQAHQTYRFATLTLGSIKQSAEAICYKNITDSVKFITTLSDGPSYIELTLAGNEDMK